MSSQLRKTERDGASTSAHDFQGLLSGRFRASKTSSVPALAPAAPALVALARFEALLRGTLHLRKYLRDFLYISGVNVRGQNSSVLISYF